ncbi:hypothetical protein [Candidatus Tisiphia endosymbiont of Hybos culiciformis]
MTSVPITCHCEEDRRSTKQSISAHFLDCFVATKVAPRNDREAI